MTQYYLIKFSDNWADEMDVDGFVIMSEGDWENYKTTAQALFINSGSVEFEVGTNEYLEYEDYADYLDKFEVEPISLEDAKLLARFFDCQRYPYGQFIGIDQIKELIDESKEDY